MTVTPVLTLALIGIVPAVMLGGIAIYVAEHFDLENLPSHRPPKPVTFLTNSDLSRSVRIVWLSWFAAYFGFAGVAMGVELWQGKGNAISLVGFIVLIAILGLVVAKLVKHVRAGPVVGDFFIELLPSAAPNTMRGRIRCSKMFASTSRGSYSIAFTCTEHLEWTSQFARLVRLDERVWHTVQVAERVFRHDSEALDWFCDFEWEMPGWLPSPMTKGVPCKGLGVSWEFDIQGYAGPHPVNGTFRTMQIPFGYRTDPAESVRLTREQLTSMLREDGVNLDAGDQWKWRITNRSMDAWMQWLLVGIVVACLVIVVVDIVWEWQTDIPSMMLDVVFGPGIVVLAPMIFCSTTVCAYKRGQMPNS
jgi:hypothetical protein